MTLNGFLFGHGCKFMHSPRMKNPLGKHRLIFMILSMSWPGDLSEPYCPHGNENMPWFQRGHFSSQKNVTGHPRRNLGIRDVRWNHNKAIQGTRRKTYHRIAETENVFALDWLLQLNCEDSETRSDGVLCHSIGVEVMHNNAGLAHFYWRWVGHS